MQVDFSFLAGHGRFTAEIPEGFLRKPDLRTVLSTGRGLYDLNVEWQGQLRPHYEEDVLDRVVSSPSGPAHVFRRKDAASYYTIRWALDYGMAQTNASVDIQQDELERMLGGVQISQAAPEHPQVRLRDPLQFGNISNLIEQDHAQFLLAKDADFASLPWSIVFRFAGSGAKDGLATDDAASSVSRAAGNGVVVEIAGPSVDVGGLRSLASSIAATVSAA